MFLRVFSALLISSCIVLLAIHVSTQSRATAAKNILKMIGCERQQLIIDYRVLTEALIQLANSPVDESKREQLQSLSKFKLGGLSSLRHTHVHTHHLKVYFH